MNNIEIRVLTAALALALAGVSSNPAVGEELAAEVPMREDMILISATAMVTAIDYETRDITLKDELGKETSLKASEEVRRFDEISVGDNVMVDYYLSLAFELREPTQEERDNPLEILADAGRASEDKAPAGGALTVIRAVCTIEGLDRPTETATLMGPLGGLNVVKVADVSNLPKLRIGDSVVVTFTEALAVALVKVEE